MDRMKDGLSIVIPAFNEEKAVGDIIERIDKAVREEANIEYEIIVVDDGSTDETSIIASKMDVKLLKHPKNLGYGKAILTGVDNARHDLIAIIDADNTYEPNDLICMLPLMKSFDMVIGVRDMKDIKQHISVKALRIFLKFIIFYFSGHSSPDPNSGLRIFKKELVVRGRDLFSARFSFTTSLTFFTHLIGRFVKYVPIRYYPRIGISKVQHLRDSTRTFVLLINMAVIYRPLKCFIALIAVSILGLLVWRILMFPLL